MRVRIHNEDVQVSRWFGMRWQCAGGWSEWGRGGMSLYVDYKQVFIPPEAVERLER